MSASSSSGPITRRGFLGTTAGAVLAVPFVSAASASTTELGQGDFRYRVVPGWGDLGPDTPVKDCHGLAVTASGHVVLLTNHVANNVIVYEPSGRLAHKWGTQFPGAHGLSLVREGAHERLFITDLSTHRVVKATLEGEILAEWRWPEASGKYERENQYRPSWTLHLPDGQFYVLDGYGRDYVLHYDRDGKLARVLGGAEGGIAHWGPHGGMVDLQTLDAPTLLIAMSDQQHLLRLGLDGSKLAEIPLPGGNPRQIRQVGEHWFVAHLADNWPADRQSRGFVSVLDRTGKVVSNIGGSAPEYDDRGVLRRMRNTTPVFQHPHDLAVDREGSLYVAQFASGGTYPIKLERV